MSVLDKYHDALEVHETMFGTKNGRLAISLDLLTDALALVGQHGVYCQVSEVPKGGSKMDIALIMEQIKDAKELVQSTMEISSKSSDNSDSKQ